MFTRAYCHGWLTLAAAPKKLTKRLEMFPQRIDGSNPPAYCPAYCNSAMQIPRFFRLRGGDIQDIFFSSAERAQKAIDEHLSYLKEVENIENESVEETAPVSAQERERAKTTAVFCSMGLRARQMMELRANNASINEIATTQEKTPKAVANLLSFYARKCGTTVPEMIKAYGEWRKLSPKERKVPPAAPSKSLIIQSFFAMRGDTAAAIQMAADGKSWAEIARKLKRKDSGPLRSSVRYHAKKLGMSTEQLVDEFRTWKRTFKRDGENA